MSAIDQEQSMMIVDAWSHAADQAAGYVHGCAADAAQEMMRPSAVYRPRVYIDGDKWCALYGDNLQDGVAGFGDSPAQAMADFDTRWLSHLSAKATP